jgi:hypothetical protein
VEAASGVAGQSPDVIDGSAAKCGEAGMNEWSPIFVCGPSRSGTALVRSILNLHSRVHLAGETHYFDDLRVRLGPGATAAVSSEQSRTVQDYFLALSHRPYGHHGDPDHGRVQREDLKALAESLGGSGDAYLEAYCRLEARHAGKSAWGEKTPRHVFRVGEILAAFPTARVVCLVRDARAIVASYRDWRNQGGFDFSKDPGHKVQLAAEHVRARRSYHPIIISMLWKGAMQAAIAAEERFGAERIRLQRYEALASDPVSAIPDLAAWLGLDLEPAMTEPPMLNSSYNSFDTAAGVSAAPIDRWREKLSSSEIAAVESVCGGVLNSLGYELVHPKGSALGVVRSWATFPFAALRAAAANRERIPNLPVYIARRLCLLTRSDRTTLNNTEARK